MAHWYCVISSHVARYGFLHLRMSQWFYAVGRGRQVGVYSSWQECQKQVENIANAKYKKFKTREEALAFIQECKEQCSPYKDPATYRISVPSLSVSSSQPVGVPQHSSNSCLIKHSVCSRDLFKSESEKPSSSKLQQFRTNASKSITLSQKPTGNEVVAPVSVSFEDTGKRPHIEKLSPQTVAALENLVDQDPFLFQTPVNKPQNRTVMESTSNNEVRYFSKLFEQIDKHYSDIKATLDQMMSRISSLETEVRELTHPNESSNSHQQPSVSRISARRALLEGAMVPQPVGKRNISTIPDSDVEIVPVPPKKIPKIEVDSDDEVDGLSHDFKVNENGYVIVYTDGACENNGRRGAKAGIGVWFGDHHPLNCSEPVHGRPTNNTAEIQAAVQALEIAKRAGVRKIIVHTDSEFTINCITKWIHKWVKNNWKVASGANVKNKEDLILLLDAMKGLDVKWEHVRGHQGIHGNEMADRLARSGADRYKE